ncbi:MAG TPA: hypothetical protein PLP21_06570 [Pyrinomonadaceae bacterium]|nr:hypothetical protein [Acidobacteriota bacterium]HQZ95965.1 hypothetical protein [Pyrinomonadaceae bacterium]
MAAGTNKRWIGVIALILGSLLAAMLVFEIKDGRLYGSSSDGMMLAAHPIVFYIGTILQGFVVLLLIFSGNSIFRNPK